MPAFFPFHFFLCVPQIPPMFEVSMVTVLLIDVEMFLLLQLCPRHFKLFVFLLYTFFLVFVFITESVFYAYKKDSLLLEHA